MIFCIYWLIAFLYFYYSIVRIIIKNLRESQVNGEKYSIEKIRGEILYNLTDMIFVSVIWPVMIVLGLCRLILIITVKIVSNSLYTEKSKE